MRRRSQCTALRPFEMEASRLGVRSRTGFTLVELLVTTSIMALVAGACVAVLAGGINVWRRAVEYGTRDQSTLITFKQMRRDLQNTRRFSPIAAEGMPNQYTFAAVERVDPDAPEELGRLGYFVDNRQHFLCRVFVPYRVMRRSRLRDACQPVLEGVTQLRFAYFGEDDDGGGLEWSPSWDSSDPPAAVKVSVVLSEGPQQTTTHSFVVSLMSVPLGEET